jgi:hypothetical protein
LAVVRETVALVILLLAFATWFTVHVAIAVRLVAAGSPRYRGLVAFLLPPLAPWWAWERNWRASTSVWILAVVVYAIVRAVAAA